MSVALADCLIPLGWLVEYLLWVSTGAGWFASLEAAKAKTAYLGSLCAWSCLSVSSYPQVPCFVALIFGSNFFAEEGLFSPLTFMKLTSKLGFAFFQDNLR